MADMLRAAAETPDEESCGLLLGQEGHIALATRAANVATDTSRRFEIDPAHLFAALRGSRQGGPEVLGHWHSHPSGSVHPSATDAAMAAGNGAVWAIVADGQIGWWRAAADGEVHGRFTAIQVATVNDSAG